ncbi:MAG: PDZ domain-containing protein [Patescibacteria group bacterium]|nr:PDZ domain-containing protein [Patescibacteria group bacterium]
MSKKKFVFIIVFSVALALLLDAMFGAWLGAKFSTVPLFNRLGWASPQSPIVINTRQQTIVQDSASLQQAAAQARPKISALLLNNNGQVSVLGSAINLTADGLFIAAKDLVDGVKPQAMYIKLDDSTIGQVSSVITDSQTGLALLKTSLTSVPAADFTQTKSLAAGDRLMLAQPGIASYSVRIAATYVVQQQGDSGEQSSSDIFSRGFKVQDPGSEFGGGVLLDEQSQVAGLWDGGRVISGDVVKKFADQYLANQGLLKRPAFGFGYRPISRAESQISGVPQGDKVVYVIMGAPAQQAGLAAGDIIIRWSGQDITGGAGLEELLQGQKPGDQIFLQVMRNKTLVSLTLTAGTYK